MWIINKHLPNISISYFHYFSKGSLAYFNLIFFAKDKGFDEASTFFKEKEKKCQRLFLQYSSHQTPLLVYRGVCFPPNACFDSLSRTV